MDDQLKEETRNLVHMWMKHDAQMLRDYLIQDVEDPRINVQSILTRHFLAGLLFQDRFAELCHQEMRFATVMNWLQRRSAEPQGMQQLDVAFAALLAGDEDPEHEIPAYVREAFEALPGEASGLTIPNYLVEYFAWHPVEGQKPGENPALAIFQNLWAEALAGLSGPRFSVLEPACGSANDYRFLDSYGLARFLDYTGMDLCAKNIANAHEMYPTVDFRVGNAMAIEAPDRSFDVCFVHDLFEHLSIAGMEAAVAEVCRVTRHALCLHFFSLHDAAGHIVNPVEYYHCNTLSLPLVRELFLRHASGVEVFNIGDYLQECYGCPETHNPNAYTFIVTR